DFHVTGVQTCALPILCSSLAHTHALMSSQRTGAITAFMPASMNLGGDLYPWVTADKQGADPFWSIHLVRRQRQQIYRLLLHIEQQLARTLSCIHMKQAAVVTADCTQLNDVVDCAQLIVYVHDAHQKRVITQCITQNRWLNTAVLIRLQ